MSKLIIDERDLRCTILEQVRELLNSFQITEVDGNMQQYADQITAHVIACCDPVPQTEQEWTDRGVVAGKLIATQTFVQTLQEMHERFVRSLNAFASTVADQKAATVIDKGKP